MNKSITLTLTQQHHLTLKSHLFPSDGKEAIAFALCGNRKGDRKHRLLVQEIVTLPYNTCLHRSDKKITWMPEHIVDSVLLKAEQNSLSVIKIHSHPSGYRHFSDIDTHSDTTLLPMIKDWVEADIYHGSSIMLPDGEMIGRVYYDNKLLDIECINVIGDDLNFWYPNTTNTIIPGFTASHAQIFDEGTIERLQRLSIAVIGCSGTGSPVIEQLVRLGVKELVLVDDDRIEERNVNRIINSTLTDAEEGNYKVTVLQKSIERMGLGTRVIALPTNLWDKKTIETVAQCDIVFGCMDSIDGRYLLNTIASYYLLPYFDIGIRLEADADCSIREVCGSIHYLQPGLSSLISRGLFNMQQVAHAGLIRHDPNAFRLQQEDGYISGASQHRPAVISVNMQAASLAVLELLARIHPFREEDNNQYSCVTFSLASMEIIYDSEFSKCILLEDKAGLGDVSPLLGLIELADKQVA